MKNIKYPETRPHELHFIDTHCHLDMNSYQEDLDDVLFRANNAGIKNIITIGIDLESSKAAILLSKKHSNVFATIGIHPHDVDAITTTTYDDLEKLAKKEAKNIVGYGEIGLDYFKNYSDHSTQRQHFTKQLQLAKKLALPVIIHDRDAHTDVLTILKENGPFNQGGVMHCFSGNLELAEKVIELGFYVSIPGIVTFKNAHEMHEVAKTIPLSSMLLETDGPFLSPMPNRGKRNEPAFIPFIADFIAGLRNIPVEEVAKATYSNSLNIFKIGTTKRG